MRATGEEKDGQVISKVLLSVGEVEPVGRDLTVCGLAVKEEEAEAVVAAMRELFVVYFEGDLLSWKNALI